MNCDYTGPNYSPEDLRSVIDAMCKSLESSGQIDEHEHPSAYSTLLDTAKWMAELEGRDWQDPVAYIDKGTGRPHWCPGALPNNLPHGAKLFARPVPAEPVNARLFDVATGKTPHLYAGRCPDSVNGPESRDPDCPACQAIAAAEAALAEPKPDADGWIPWVGGECPVDPNALVRVRFADFLEEGGCRACQYQWHRSNPHAPSDIVAYRVAGESK